MKVVRVFRKAVIGNVHLPISQQLVYIWSRYEMKYGLQEV